MACSSALGLLGMAPFWVNVGNNLGHVTVTLLCEEQSNDSRHNLWFQILKGQDNEKYCALAHTHTNLEFGCVSLHPYLIHHSVFIQPPWRQWA